MRAKMERSTIIDEVVCSNIWGDVTYSSNTYELYTVNFVSSQTIDVDVAALHTDSFSWDLYSGSGDYVTYYNGQEMSLYLESSGSASFHVSYSNPCDLDAASLTFVHSGGWFTAGPNPTYNCVDIEATDDYEVSYIKENGKWENLKIQPMIKTLKVVDDHSNIYRNKTYGKGVKYDHICIEELDPGMYYILINEGEKDMNMRKLMKI